MIIQNGQNRNLAICNARQVAMLRGGQWIIEPIVLSYAVKSQIYEDIVTTGHHSASLALEVWRAANLYCKSHAASHPELTAQGKLLSAFVNADKDMYCSLPLALTPEAQSALPTRWLVGDKNAYIRTNYYANTNTNFDFKLQIVEYSTSNIGLLGGTSSGNSQPFDMFLWSQDLTFPYGNEKKFRVSNVSNILRLTKDENCTFNYYENETLVSSNTYSKLTYTSRNPLCLYCLNRGSVSYKSSHKIAWLRISESTEILNLVPYNNNGVKCMLDLQTLTFHQNAGTGTFTIEKS